MSSIGQNLFPFAAIVGQEDMKRALLLNIVDPGIGGVLVKGEKGTAKSTTIRSLVQVLPEVEYIKGCPFHCDPKNKNNMCAECSERYHSKKYDIEVMPMRVVELPLSATEDRVAGTLDLEHVLQTGQKKFEPGVLAQANRNLLYVDEVNLLDDHIVDLLLDSAAMGVNYVEREGVSFSHPSKFILVGSMNPEEGDLRPQLLDRFGLCVEIIGERTIEYRAEVVMRRLEFDSDPVAFTEKYKKETVELRNKIKDARERVLGIKVDRSTVVMASEIAMHFDMEGHRADITLVRAARANAAFEGRDSVTKEDLAIVAPMVLSHRIKRKPFEDTKFDRRELEECLSNL
ncbi:MAG: ATP-binding protein [Candidatus Methanogranum gryphiswaldense]|nr:MAG: ATP-binding protein [Candidatus Methanogranum sp. U3.2.1]